MTRRSLIASVAACAAMLTFGVPRGARSQAPAAHGSDPAAVAFLASLQRAIKVGDHTQVARLVHFPLRVNHGPNRHETIRTAAALARGYATIFPAAVRAAILAEKPATLNTGPQGISIARGMVWAEMTCNPRARPVCRIGLISINLPQ